MSAIRSKIFSKKKNEKKKLPTILLKKKFDWLKLRIPLTDWLIHAGTGLWVPWTLRKHHVNNATWLVDYNILRQRQLWLVYIFGRSCTWRMESSAILNMEKFCSLRRKTLSTSFAVCLSSKSREFKISLGSALVVKENTAKTNSCQNPESLKSRWDLLWWWRKTPLNQNLSRFRG